MPLVEFEPYRHHHKNNDIDNEIENNIGKIETEKARGKLVVMCENSFWLGYVYVGSHLQGDSPSEYS